MAKHGTRLSSQILEQASAWFIDFNEGEVDAVARQDFDAWLRRSPEHVRAYLQISAFWEDASVLLMKPRHLEIEALVARAAAEQNVFPLELSGCPTGDAGPQPASFRPKSRQALAATLLLVIGTSLGTWYVTQRNTYATETGEQRSITLEDGSSVELNSRSRLKVRFTEGERTVELLVGQALFRVARNPARPFIVSAGDTRVRAVGTEFDVYRKNTGTVVTVVEGRVAVTASAQAQRDSLGIPAARDPGTVDTQQPELRLGEILLAAGEQVELTPANSPVPRRANIAIATAWTEQKLVFESTPLREVVEEFNRYNRQQLVIRDRELYEFHVSGVFPSADSNRMIEFLRQRFGVTMSRSGDEIEISRRNERNDGGSVATPPNSAPSTP